MGFGHLDGDPGSLPITAGDFHALGAVGGRGRQKVHDLRGGGRGVGGDGIRGLGEVVGPWGRRQDVVVRVSARLVSLLMGRREGKEQRDSVRLPESVYVRPSVRVGVIERGVGAGRAARGVVLVQVRWRGSSGFSEGGMTVSMGRGDGVGVGGRFGCGGGGLVVKGVQLALAPGRFRGSEAVVSHMGVGDGTGGRSERRLQRGRSGCIVGGVKCGSRGRRRGVGLMSLGILEGGKRRDVGRGRRRKRKSRRGGWRGRREREGREGGRPALIHHQTERIGRSGCQVKVVAKVEILAGWSGCRIADKRGSW